ncbi:MAG TPA: CHAT domain-containing protein [Pyrinomonadaceae bacterium]|nr:CHAT domain-containing protein [Pyrinomonadaceae bacterium]
MSGKIRVLLLSANPLPTSRILVDLEAREIRERLEEGPHRNRFELYQCEATRPIDIQKLMLKHGPHIVHFCGHGHKTRQIILDGAPGRAKTVDNQGLAQVFALYKHQVHLVVLNACFTDVLARSIVQTVDYAVGSSLGIGDKAAVAFAGAFYRALGFGKSIPDAFKSAKAELALTKISRSRGIELFIKNGVGKQNVFPCFDENRNLPRRTRGANRVLKTEIRFQCRITLQNNSASSLARF